MGRRARANAARQFDEVRRRPPAGGRGRGGSRGVPDGVARAVVATDVHVANAGTALRISYRTETGRCEIGLRADQFVWVRRRQRDLDPAEVGLSVFIRGCGAVSPAGWGVTALANCLVRGEPVPAKDIVRPGWTQPLRGRTVPPPAARP